MVKTTIDIDDERWKKFSIKVIQDYGGRKKNDVIEGLVEVFLRDPKVAEGLQNWLKKEKERQTKS
jgi:hypothetical protein